MLLKSFKRSILRSSGKNNKQTRTSISLTAEYKSVSLSQKSRNCKLYVSLAMGALSRVLVIRCQCSTLFRMVRPENYF